MKRDCLHYSLVLFFPWSWSVVSSSPTPHRHPLVSSRASQPSRPTRLTNHQHVLRQPQTVVRPINMSIGKPAPIISFKERRSLFGQPATRLTLTLLSPPTNISMAQCPSLVFNLRFNFSSAVTNSSAGAVFSHQHVLRQPQAVVRPTNMSTGKHWPSFRYSSAQSLLLVNKLLDDNIIPTTMTPPPPPSPPPQPLVLHFCQFQTILDFTPLKLMSRPLAGHPAANRATAIAQPSTNIFFDKPAVI